MCCFPLFFLSGRGEPCFHVSGCVELYNWGHTHHPRRMSCLTIESGRGSPVADEGGMGFWGRAPQGRGQGRCCQGRGEEAPEGPGSARLPPPRGIPKGTDTATRRFGVMVSHTQKGPDRTAIHLWNSTCLSFLNPPKCIVCVEWRFPPSSI